MNFNMIVTKITRKVQCNNKGQWTITLPSSIVGVMELERGDILEFTIVGDVSNLEIRLKRFDQ